MSGFCEQRADIWSLEGVMDAICITTNGAVAGGPAAGRAIMGKGCALEAKERYPQVPYTLGRLLLEHGNRVHTVTRTTGGAQLVSFPVKPVQCQVTSQSEIDTLVVPHMRRRFRPGDTVPGWACVADPVLITASCQQLSELATQRLWLRVALPRPGCGAGSLGWGEVRQILERYLDNRFTVCYR